MFTDRWFWLLALFPFTNLAFITLPASRWSSPRGMLYLRVTFVSVQQVTAETQESVVKPRAMFEVFLFSSSHSN